MIKYEKYDQELNLDEVELSKIKLVDGEEMPENIWCKQIGNKVVLMNHALAFYPFPTWGLVMNLSNGSIDAKSVKDAEPSILTLVSEAFDDMVERGFIFENGTINPDYKDPSEVEHAPKNKFEVMLGGYYLYDGIQLESRKNYTHLAISTINDGTKAVLNHVSLFSNLKLLSESDNLKIVKLKYPLRWALSKKTDKPNYNAYACYYDTRNGSLKDIVEATAFSVNASDFSTFRNLSFVENN